MLRPQKKSFLFSLPAILILPCILFVRTPKSFAQETETLPSETSSETQTITPVPVIPLTPGTQGNISFQVDDPAIYSKTKIIKLQNIKASEIEPFIRKRLSKFGSVQISDENNALIVTDREPKLSDIENLILKLDKEGKNDFVQFETQVIPLKYVKASTFKSIAPQKLSPDGSLQVNDDLNVLIVTDVKSKIENFKKVIESLDIPPKQILLEAKIIEVRRTDASEYGVDIVSLLQSASFDYTKAKSDSSTTGSASETTTSKGVQFSLSPSDVSTVLNFLFEKGNAKMVSSQRIVTLNNTEGEITMGTSSLSSGSLSSSRSTVPVLRLTVTPTVGSDGFITLNISAGSGSFQTILNSPLFFQNSVTSSVIIKDGDTFVLGGFKGSLWTKAKRKFPLLGEIPVLDFFFSKRTLSLIETDLLVLVTPHIITESKPSEEDAEFLKKLLKKK